MRGHCRSLAPRTPYDVRSTCRGLVVRCFFRRPPHSIADPTCIPFDVGHRLRFVARRKWCVTQGRLNSSVFGADHFKERRKRQFVPVPLLLPSTTREAPCKKRDARQVAHRRHAPTPKATRRRRVARDEHRARRRPERPSLSSAFPDSTREPIRTDPLQIPPPVAEGHIETTVSTLASRADCVSQQRREVIVIRFRRSVEARDDPGEYAVELGHQDERVIDASTLFE